MGYRNIEEVWRNIDTVIMTRQFQEDAKELSFKADTEGVTGFMYGCAVGILSKCWEYGEELRKWHNKKYDYEGDGIVNPAILKISK